MKISWLDVLLFGLATYRMALAVSKESGPFWMFKLLRRNVKKHAPDQTHMDEGIECLWCMSMQFGIVVVVTAYFWKGNAVYDGCILALAISAIAIVLNQAFTKGGK